MKAKPESKTPEIEELHDAWERFEKAFDTVMKAPPKPSPPKNPRDQQPVHSPAPHGKRGGTKQA